MDEGALMYHGRLQDVKEFNPELFATWQGLIRKARLLNVEFYNVKYHFIECNICCMFLDHMYFN